MPGQPTTTSSRPNAVPAVAPMITPSAARQPEFSNPLTLSKGESRQYNLVMNRGPFILSQGWAAKSQEGRSFSRQVIALVIPGDRLGFADNLPLPDRVDLCAITQISLTPIILDDAGSLGRPTDGELYMNQIYRLGLEGQGKMAHWLLELYDRLEIAGLARDNVMSIPLTQELIASCLSTTYVHISRTLSRLRQAGYIDYSDRTAERNLRILNRKALVDLCGYEPFSSMVL